jgi:hypothetical protein
MSRFQVNFETGVKIDKLQQGYCARIFSIAALALRFPWSS